MRIGRLEGPDGSLCWVGETFQSRTTADMIFGVAELIAFCSQSFTLEPGDLILTGTPWGRGDFMDPRRSLAAGDLVGCEIGGIGAIENRVEMRHAASG